MSCRTKVHSPSQKSEIFASPLKEGAKFGAPIQQPAKLQFAELSAYRFARQLLGKGLISACYFEYFTI